MELLLIAVVVMTCTCIGCRVGASASAGKLSADIRAEAYRTVFSAMFHLELKLGATAVEPVFQEQLDAVVDAENDICILIITAGHILPDHVTKQMVLAMDSSGALDSLERSAKNHKIRMDLNAYARKDLGQAVPR